VNIILLCKLYLKPVWFNIKKQAVFVSVQGCNHSMPLTHLGTHLTHSGRNCVDSAFIAMQPVNWSVVSAASGMM
jgi:hypothetical protein